MPYPEINELFAADCPMRLREVQVDRWQAFGWGEFADPGPQTESSIERGFRQHAPVDDQWGRSDSLDPDNLGDIADEGAGHRG